MNKVLVFLYFETYLYLNFYKRMYLVVAQGDGCTVLYVVIAFNLHQMC